MLDQALLLVRVPAWPLQARVAVLQLMPLTVALRPPVLPLLVRALLVRALLVRALLVRVKAILLLPQLRVRGQLLTPEPAPK
ncbi:hypothetical protein LBMAG30_04050 [Comamonadaceae bacterium]|nr:hypothetical protein LBMAG30_04050 [Comamonadaceae bacterium]